MRLLICGLLAASCYLLSTGAAAQAPGSTRDSGDAAHLFAYWPKPGQQAAFDQGYRRHLQWHRDHRDPLVWYGWYVSHGQRVGMFIDGSFGAPFATFDRRVDPAGDGADANVNVTPHADTAFRTSYRLRRELGNGVPLERWQPSPQVQAVHYTVKPGMRQRFEEVVLAARPALAGDGAPMHTWYERVTGGAPGYLLLIARDGWDDYDRPDDSLDALLQRSGDPRTAALLDQLAASVIAVETETWQYRKDLSYFPEH